MSGPRNPPLPGYAPGNRTTLSCCFDNKTNKKNCRLTLPCVLLEKDLRVKYLRWAVI